MSTNLVQAVVVSIEGEVAYSDGTNDTFEASVDANGIQQSLGTTTAFADAFPQIKAMFTALGGSITGSPVVSGKTVSSLWTRFEISGDTAGGKFATFAEYRPTPGAYAGAGGAADYATAVANFKAIIQSVISLIAGVPVTIR